MTVRERLMQGLCIDLGFCLPPADTARLLAWEAPPIDAFTDAVFAAEEMVQPYDLHLYRQVRTRVAEALRREQSL
jgi:hypothetical protein